MATDLSSESSDTAASEFDWLTLDDGEQVQWSGKPHVYSIVPALIVGLPLALFLIGIPIVVGAYLNRENTVYLLTNEALYRKSGILSRDVQKIEFEKVQNISYSQGALGNYFGYGTVDISTAGGTGVEMQFRSVPDPKAVQQRINEQSRRARGKGADDRSTSESPEQVLEDIRTELRAIRRAVEAGGRDATPTDPEGDDGGRN
ncbi:PH domain-containing protein [Halorientalis pallida]|uniref:PH domain-containing protein n=1 Tax=Halorientalis pallida TaxID=2479928 RepID=A0A498KWR0_9EURY|nr:PH domain-containing protein [Halorientalis pallida]RXK50052.1 PH domain-containing protein [Halorientalis pallida]